MITSVLVSLLLPALVSAHGYINRITIDGTTYQGNPVGDTPTIKSAIRQINTNSPVKGASNPNLNCGQDAQLAADVANANPGSTVEVYWVGGTSGTSDNWPHNVGPIMHYMAQCDGSCATYNSSGAKWFKISQQTLLPNSSNTWYMSQLQSGSPATVTIPKSLKPGNYLLRSELITLQLAMTPGGAEFYPACVQLSVGGSGTEMATSNEEVTFPGGYSDSDPGILVDVYNPPLNYTPPGPPIPAFIMGDSSSGNSTTGSGTGSSSSSGSASAPEMPSPSASSSSAPSGPSIPANVGGGTPSSVTPTPVPTSSGGSGSTCMRKRSAPKSNFSVKGKRAHRHRYRTSH